jgi:hypothetical protein
MSWKCVDAKPSTVISVPIKGGCSAGDLLVLVSAEWKKAGTAPAAGTIVGIALGDADDGDRASVEFIGGRLVMTDYAGTTKTSLADADLGKIFDINGTSLKLDLDDTTGGVFVVTDYDNARKVAFGFFTEASVFNG